MNSDQLELPKMLVKDQEIAKLRKKRKSYHEQLSIHVSDIDDYISKGWTLDRKQKRKASVHRPKSQNQIFEDRVWCLFAEMGFSALNKDNKCEIEYTARDKEGNKKVHTKHQIDVIAIDDECVLVIECKSAEKERTKVTFKKDIESIMGYKKGVIDTIKTQLPETNGNKFLFMFATNNYDISTPDKERLQAQKIFHLDERTIEYYQELTRNLGHAAKYQFMAHVFEGEKIKNLNTDIPAIRGKMGGHTYYSFSIEPLTMLKISYVLHRNKTLDIHKPTYQRIIKRARLNEINSFINKGGFFPNSILVNVTNKNKRHLNFNPIAKQSDATISALGILSLPQQFGCAHIIDGQHRLYGYANSKYIKTNTIPVVLFENLEGEKQVQLFMQINENQKAVSKQLRHLLNADLLIGDADPQKQIDGYKLRIALNLGESSSSALKDYVLSDISAKTEKRNVTIEAIKTGLDASHFFNKYSRNSAILEDGYLDNGNPEKTSELTYSYLEHCFNYLAENITDEWEKAKGSKGDKGILTTNHGIGGLIRIFDDIVITIADKENVSPRVVPLEVLFDSADKYLKYLVLELRDLNNNEKDDLRKRNGAGAPLAYWHKFQQCIQKHCQNFIAHGLSEYVRNMSKKFNEDTRNAIDTILYRLKEATIVALKQMSTHSDWEFEMLPPKVYKSISAKATDYKLQHHITDVKVTDFLSLEDLKSTAKSNWQSPIDSLYSLPSDTKSKSATAKLHWLDFIITISKKDFNTYSVREDEYMKLKGISDELLKHLDTFN